MQGFSRKIWLVALVLVGTAAFLWHFYLPVKGVPTVKEEQVVRWQIGVIESLTGPAAFLGEQNKKGIEAAKVVLERKDPNLKLDIWHEDSLYSGQGGISAYQKLRSVNKLDAVMTHASPISLPLQSVIAADGLLQVATATSADSYSTKGDLSVRVSARTSVESGVMSERLCKTGIKSLAIFGMNNEIGKSMVKSLRQNLDSLACGITIVNEEYFDPANADFKPLFGKLPKSASPDFYIAGLSVNVAVFLKQKSELGISGQVYSFRTVEDPSFLPATGALAEGLVYTYAFDPLRSGERVREFVETYKSLYGEDPDGFAAEGFEGLMVTVSALKQCGRNDACLRDVFQSWGKVDSVFGPMTFDENGDVAYPFFLKTVKDGKFVRLEVAH